MKLILLNTISKRFTIIINFTTTLQAIKERLSNRPSVDLLLHHIFLTVLIFTFSLFIPGTSPCSAFSWITFYKESYWENPNNNQIFSTFLINK